MAPVSRMGDGTVIRNDPISITTTTIESPPIQTTTTTTTIATTKVTTSAAAHTPVDEINVDPLAHRRSGDYSPFTSTPAKYHPCHGYEEVDTPAAIDIKAAADTMMTIQFEELPEGEKERNRRMSSDEWDAAKTRPSQFQQRKNSLYSTPNSRDSHINKHVDRDAAFHAKHAEKFGKDTKSKEKEPSEEESRDWRRKISFARKTSKADK